MATDVKTICPYCGVGCGLIATTDGRRILRVRGDPEHPANFGRLCRKGATVAQTVNVRTRLRYPMLRDASDERPAVVPADTAVRHIADRLADIRRRHGEESIAFYLSGQLTTEAQYLANMFAKGFLRTNHVDANSRLCMASAVSGMKLSLGSDGPPTCYADIEQADTFLFIGSNAADCHPVAFERVLKRMRRFGTRCIVVDPRRTATAERATLHLPIRPGTDLALLNGLLHLLRNWRKLDTDFIVHHTNGWQEVDRLLDDYPPEAVAETCGISIDQLLAAARLIADAHNLLSFWTMGVNQHIQGTSTVNALCNLHLALGQIGKPGCGPFSLTGQSNAMGGRDVGYLSQGLPGYRTVADESDRREVECRWGLPAGTIRSQPGHDAVAMFEAMRRGSIRVLWIIGTNPAASMPNLPVVREALEAAELVIVQDAYYPTETTRYAHAILPAAVNLEQTGTFCNSERRVSLLEEVVPPPGEARPDWVWIRDVALAMGFERFARYESADRIFDEFARLTAGRPDDQSALHHNRLRVAGPQSWPFPAMGESSERRYVDGRFPTPDTRARFHARAHLGTGETVDEAFPLLLTTGRTSQQWHTRTKTGHVEQFTREEPGPRLLMHPEDAAELRLCDGQAVTIHSRRGMTQSTLRVDETMTPGVVFLSMHWNALFAPLASCNEVTSDRVDPVSRQPALKQCAVRIEAICSASDHSCEASDISTASLRQVEAGAIGLSDSQSPSL